MQGDVDMPKAEYDLLFDMKNNTSRAFHLWISKRHSRGIVMEVEDTANAYQ